MKRIVKAAQTIAKLCDKRKLRYLTVMVGNNAVNLTHLASPRTQINFVVHADA